jgi:type I restriction enzyme, S subunit
VSEWREVALGDVIELKRGYDLPTAQRREGSVPIVSSSGPTGFHDEAKVSGPGVVTGRYGTLGEVFYIEEDFWPLNTALYVRDFKGNHPRFVAALLSTLDLGRRGGAAAVPGVNRNHLHVLPVTIPDPATQVRIGEVLVALDDLIENTRRRIALLEQMAQTIYREWFVHFRYPGHEDDELVDSPLGPVPTRFDVAPLGACCNINREQRRPEPDEEIVYIDISALGERTVALPPPIVGSDAPGRARRVLSDGDIVWSMVRPGRRAHALLVKAQANWIGSTGLAVISPNGVPPSFVFEFVSTPTFSDYLVGKEQGAAYPAVRPIDFEQAQTVVPPEEVLGAFDAVVSPIHVLGWELAAQARAAAQLRDLLLPKLVTGAIDVSHLDLDALLEETAA